MPSWGIEGLFWYGAALCSYHTWNGEAGSMGGLFEASWYLLR